MGLSELSTRLSARNYDSNNLMEVLDGVIARVNSPIGTFRITRLSLSDDLHLDPDVGCQIIGTLYPMVPYPPGTIFAYLSDGRVVFTRRPLLFLPNMPLGDHYLWFDTGKRSKVGNKKDGSLNGDESASIDLFAIK